VALIYARRRYAVDFDKLFLLGVGTASPDPTVTDEGRLERGISGWLLSKDRSLVLLTLDAQEDLSRRLVAEIMQRRYLHIDATPSPDEAKHLRLDLANAKSTEVLKKLAQDATRSAFRKAALKAFF
jgi:hypothetical protein